MKDEEVTRLRKLARDESSTMAVGLIEKAQEIKLQNPQITRRIDRLEREVREKLEAIRGEISRLSKKDQDLVKILVINGIQRTAEEVLID